MKQRLMLLATVALGFCGIVSGCSAIGFVGGTVIDNTMTEERAVAVPSAEQVRDSSDSLPKGKRLVVETISGETWEGIYAGTRQVPVQLEKEDLASAVETGYVQLYPDAANQLQRSVVRLASRALAGSEDGFGGPSEESVTEGQRVTVRADALLLLAEDGPAVVPLYTIGSISVVQPKETRMRLVLLGAITDLVILQGVLGYLLTSS